MDYPQLSDSGIQLPIRPKAIAFDLDGTLLDYDGRLSDPVSRAVNLIAKAGIKVFLITGRQQSGCEEYWKKLGLDTPVATCNGAHVGFFDQDPLLHIRLSPEGRDIILDLEAKHDLYINYYIDGGVFSTQDSIDRDYYSRHFSPVSLSSGRDDIAGRNPPTKCLCITSEDEQSGVMKLLAKALDGVAVVTRSNTRFIEILPPNADKGIGLRALAEWAGIPVDRFVAVGDAMNDLPMLRIAGFSIAFKSGDPKLFEHVDMILPPLWEDGMDILAKCILGMTNSGRFLTPHSRRFSKRQEET